jgi:uncharacterized membrane protein YhaH (DUF805 family)
MKLVRLWFGLSDRVGHRAYVASGTGLMVLKYLVDVAVVWHYTGRVYTPADYLSPLWSVRQHVLQGVPPGAMLALGAWALMFLWIGVGMSLRRAADAGKSPWLALLFFVPYVNLVLMVALSLLPSVPAARWRTETPEAVLDERFKSALLGILISLAVTIPTVLLAVYFKRSYSAGLFLGTPFTLGWITGHVFNRVYPRTAGQTAQVALLGTMLAGAALFLFAAEGAVCLILAFPLAAGVAILGGLLGRAIALRGSEPVSRAWMGALFAPMLVLTEPRLPAPSYEALSVVEIDAPPATVWRYVVTFPDLPPPTEAVFRIGVAAPLRARIEGSGVGAIRYCDFTTGSFVEPITAWEEGHLLAFDIVRQAPPMQEWSPYRDVNPPHLNGYFRATRGEFRLVPLPGGRTRLEGRTSYEVEMFPQGYWAVPAGRIISAIHLRVLRHIKALAEEAPRPDRSSSPSTTGSPAFPPERSLLGRAPR